MLHNTPKPGHRVTMSVGPGIMHVTCFEQPGVVSDERRSAKPKKVPLQGVSQGKEMEMEM